MTSAAIPAFLELRVETDARLREVVRAHYDPLWRFLRRMGTPEGHVEDAAQQVLLVFARRAHEVEKRGGETVPSSGLLRSGSRADFLTQGAARSFEIADAEAILRHPDPGPDAEDQLGQKERRRFLDAILDGLPPENRAVFVLAELEEITMAEIARLLEIPPGTVASRLRRARELVEAGALELRSRREREEGRGDEEA